MTQITRREFLKLSTITGATLALANTGLDKLLLEKKKQALLQELKEPRYKTRYFTCKICGGGCVLKAYLDENNRIVKIEGDSRDWVSHGTPCVKGKTVLKMLYDPQRLKKPLKRTNPERGFQLDKNGSLKGMIDPKWIETSWDTALDTIADKIAEAIKTWGPQSIVFIGHGHGSALAKLIGTPNVIKHHSTCHSTWNVIIEPMFGNVPNADMRSSKLIISFGFDQGAGKSKNSFAWLFAEAKHNGAEIIVFEPRLSETANKATRWIPIKPGTDAAVAMAMLNVIIMEELYNREFLLKYTNAPALLDADTMKYVRDAQGRILAYDEASSKIVPLDQARKPALEYRGTLDGVKVATVFALLKERVSEYTPEWASRKSGVPADTIRSIARKFATTKPASIPHWKRSGGTGPGRDQGVETYKAIAAMMVLTGNIEVPGGWLFNRTAKFVSKAVSKTPKKTFADLYPIPKEYEGKTIDEREMFPVYKKYGNEGAYQKIWYNMLRDKPYPVKVVIVWGQGLQAMMDYNLIVEAMKHIVRDNNGLIVNVNIYPDEMATLADIVLPEKFFMEGGPSIGFSKSFDQTWRINWIDGIEPVYSEVKSEHWITKELAYRIGEKLGIPKSRLESEYFSEYFLLDTSQVLEKMIKLYNEKLGVNLTLEELQTRKIYSIQEWKPVDLTKLKTESGRIELVPVLLAEYGYDPLPRWKDTFTYQDTLGKDELLLVTSVFAMNRHSKTVNNEWLRFFLEKQHANKIWIHPIVASRLGIREDDIIIVEFQKPFNPSVLKDKPSYKLAGRAHITEAVRPDVLFIPHGTGQLSKFMASYGFGPHGGDGTVKPVMLDYANPSAASMDQDIVVRVVRNG